MKQTSMDDLNLRNAFAEESDVCHTALMYAARSVREEQPMKRVSLRVILIAMVVIMATTLSALAAGSMLGWIDFFNDREWYGIPQDAVDEMTVTTSETWHVGPLSFTLKELMADSHFAISGIHIATVDNSPALLTGEPYDTLGASGDDGIALAETLGVAPELTWMDTARMLNLPLYCVRGILEIDPVYATGESMEYTMWNEDGSVTYLSMPMLNGVAKDRLPAQFFLRVAQIDPCTGEELNRWTSREHTAEIQVSDMLEEKTIYPVQPTGFSGFGFQSAHLKRYVTGVYVDMTFAAEDGMQPEDAYKLYEMRLCDQRGNPLPEGMMMGGSIDTSAWPQVVFTCMLGMEDMPEDILLTLPTSVLAR